MEIKQPENSSITSNFSKIWIGYVFGIALVIIEVMMGLLPDNSLEGLGILLSIIGYIYSLYCIHKFHKILYENTAYPLTPNKVIGLHFVPLYNLYWIFVWPKQLIVFLNNRLSAEQKIPFIFYFIFPLCIFLRWFDSALSILLLFAFLDQLNRRISRGIYSGQLVSENDKTIIKKRIRLKEATELNVSKNSAQNFLKEMAQVFGIFLVLNSFVIASFEVPTGSMMNEILPGDFLIVNKFIFGGTTPRTIPLTDIRIPNFKFPALRSVHRNDVIVFEFPGNRDEAQANPFAYYLKRCIAIAGDTLEIRQRKVYVNGAFIPFPRNVNFEQAGAVPHYADPRIFPKGKFFNEQNYGPIRIPKQGDVIQLTMNNIEHWETFLLREKNTLDFRNGKIFVNKIETTTYTVKRDYVFGMGDNRDNSLDSRFWGFIPEEDVIGTPLFLYWSWNPDIPFTQLVDKLASIRLSRVGYLVK